MAPALADWPMANHDPSGNRFQGTETTIGCSNVSQLAPRSVLQTAGNIYATPLVVDGAVYVPDQGAKLWKVDARTGSVVWSTALREASESWVKWSSFGLVPCLCRPT